MEQSQEIQQAIISLRQNLEFNKTDEELNQAINLAIAESKTLKEDMDNIGKINKLYWRKGTQTDLARVHPKKSKTVSNRIFTDVETAIPILTSETPEPTVVGMTDNAIQEKLQKGLEIAYEVKYKMQQKLQHACRHWFLFRLGIMKYRWDKDKGFTTENVLVRKIGFDKRATSKENCEYAFEELEDTAENIAEKFPKKKTEIMQLAGGKNPKAKLKYYEFWGGNGEWVCWKIREIILDKKKNPNFDYEDPSNNLFDTPQFPYLLLNVFSFGDETGLYDETSLIEETIPLQEGANKLEQQIIDLNEGQKRVWTVAGESVSDKIFQQLVDSTGDLGVRIDGKVPPGGIGGAIGQVQSGKPDASLFNNLTHLLGEIDNTMGIHSTTRGERAQQETLGGRQLLMGSDYGRLDLIVRNVEQLMEEWYNAYLHMLKVYATESEVLSNGKDRVELNREEIPQGIMVMVKKGSTLPIDRKTKMEVALKLGDMAYPKLIYEEMGYPSPEQKEQELIAWLTLTGKIAPQPQMLPTGQSGATGVVPQGNPQGGAEGNQEQQLARLQGILSSPEFQQLPPEEQQQMAQQAREIVNTIKGGQIQQ